jgi:Uma2 family endonuclease
MAAAGGGLLELRPTEERAMSTTTEPLMTAEEFIEKYGHCSGVELVDGRVVWAGQDADAAAEKDMPRFRHGVVSYRALRVLSDFIEANRLGWLAINDTFVRTRRSPDRVRGADLLFVSYSRLPAGPTPEDLTVSPELVVEVRSPTDRMNDLIAKATEYIGSGVTVVLVIDPVTESAAVFRRDEWPQRLHNGDELTLPDVLPGFAVPVRRFFE